MHRVTSAEALSTSAGHVKSANPIPVHNLLPYISEALERLDEPEQNESDISDDVPLLQTRSANLSHQSTHIFNIAPPDLQENEEHTGTAWREAAASLRLAAPITVQVLTNLTHLLQSLSSGGLLISVWTEHRLSLNSLIYSSSCQLLGAWVSMSWLALPWDGRYVFNHPHSLHE